MKGRNHLAASAMAAGAIMFALYALAYFAFSPAAAVFTGSLLGCLLPDVDAVDAMVFRRKVGGGHALEFFGYATKWALYKPVAVIASLFGGRDWGHRGALHSLAGAGLVTLFWLAVGGLVAYSLDSFALFADWFFFCLGIGFGFVLHLWQDSLTVSGVRWLPTLQMRGRISTGYSGWRVWRMETGALAIFTACSFASAALTVSGNPKSGLATALLAFPLTWLAFGRLMKFREYDKASEAFIDVMDSSLADPEGLRKRK